MNSRLSDCEAARIARKRRLQYPEPGHYESDTLQKLQLQNWHESFRYVRCHFNFNELSI